MEGEPFGDEPGFGDLEDMAGSPQVGAAPGGKPPVKPFPIKWVGVGLGGLIVVLGGLFVLSSMKGHHSDGDDMQALPQPQMQAAQPAAQPASPQVPPLPPGAVPGGQPGWQGQVPGQPQAGMQPGAPMNGIPQPVQAAPGSMQPQYGQQPMQPGMQPGVPNGQTPVMQQLTQPGMQPGQPQYAQPQPAIQQPQPVQPVGVGPDQGQAQQQPIGPTPTPARRAVLHPAAAAVSPEVAQIRTQIEALQHQLNQLTGNSAAASADTATDGGASDAAATPAKHREHPARVARGKGAKARAAASNKPAQDNGYELTSMINNQAFVTKKGSGDVNASITLAPGATLDDGRKVVQVDGKGRRVWLSDGKYIGLPGDSGSQSAPPSDSSSSETDGQ
jgi:hypothetical protein